MHLILVLPCNLIKFGFRSKLKLVLIHPYPLFPPFLLSLFHRMSAEEEQFGTESPDDNALVDIPEPSKKKKGKGGKTKEVNNARGIPESVRIKMGYDTPPEETKQ